MTAIQQVNAANVSSEQLDALRAFASQLDESELRDLLLSLTDTVDEGTDVALLEADGELTPSQAAARLRMSRTHLYKLLDNGELPSHRVGRDRRIACADLLVFEAKRQRDRRELAEQFAHAEANRNAAIDELVADL